MIYIGRRKVKLYPTLQASEMPMLRDKCYDIRYQPFGCCGRSIRGVEAVMNDLDNHGIPFGVFAYGKNGDTRIAVMVRKEDFTIFDQ